MPTYLLLGTLTQKGYDAMETGPDTVLQFVDRIAGMGGRFDGDDYFTLHGEYDFAAFVDLPSDEAVAKLADTYARTGRGRLQTELILTEGLEEYERFVADVVG